MKRFVLLFLAFLPTDDQPQKAEQKCAFAPEWNFQVPIDAEKTSGITESEFYEVQEKISTTFSSKVSELGAELIVGGDWESAEVNASAFRKGDNWHIVVSGGLARHEKMTVDGLMLVFCHELGHHFGGFPTFSDENDSWASVEGQADYYAALKCLRQVWADDNNLRVIKDDQTFSKLPEFVHSYCQERFKDSVNAISICGRSAVASLVVAKYLAMIEREHPPFFETPNRRRVDATIEYHPNAQCRLDTFFQGTLCNIDHRIPLGDNPDQGACSRAQLRAVGSRPLCWYKPPNGRFFAP